MTIPAWLCRSEMQGKKLHKRFLAELERVYVQLGELWANVKDGSQDMWLWVASDVKTKLVPMLTDKRWTVKELFHYSLP